MTKETKVTDYRWQKIFGKGQERYKPLISVMPCAVKWG